ncbi:MAG: response regulator [Hyphomicrobiaceae bacterium]
MGALLIADDHEVFRYGLAQVLRRSLRLEAVLEAASFEEALAQLDDPRLLVAIFDLGMPGLCKIELLSKVRRKRPDVRLVVLSASEAREDILAALAAGAHGYIVKNTTTPALVEHVRNIMAGTIYVPPCLADLPPEGAELSVANGDPALAGLTDRQRDVLKLIARGLSNKRIAHALSISEGTVKMHVTSILRVTGSSNRAQAAALGRQFAD